MALRTIVRFLFSLSASGKTTLIKRLREMGFLVVDTSELLIRWGNLHQEDKPAIDEAMFNGDAVDDDIVNNAVADFLAIYPNTDWLISGYPRTLGQAEHAVDVFGPHQEQHFIYLNTPEDECRRRFNKSLKKKDRGERVDGDRLEAAEKRFARDAKNIPIVLRHLDGCNLRGYFHEISGIPEEEEVFQSLQIVVGLEQSVSAV